MDEIFDKNVKIVFDTSFWIDIYRNLPTTIDTIINALKNDNFYDRILIPSFVVKEFEKNKHKGMSEHNQINKNVNEALSEAIKKGKKFISNAIESQKKRYKIENYVVENSINEHLKNIEEQGKIFLSNINNDKLSNSYLEVEKFFNDIRQKNYIDELSKDEILELFISGEDRYKKKIPPGFMDKVKEDKGGFIYGDLIIWREIIAYAKNNRTDILFVTNDTKKDWFDNDQFDKRLVKEFND